jgi:ribose-phosphate pyrophosphokinase
MPSSHLVHFALPGFEALLPPAFPGQHGRLGVERFANRELWVAVESEVDGACCVVLGSIAPPDEQMLALALTTDTLKRHGAARVIALLPYLAYARQDEEEPGKALGIAWAGEVLRASGVDELITIDIHSRRAAELLAMPVTSLSPADLFAAELKRLDLLDATIVAPDEGAIERCSAVAEAAGIARPIVHLRKERTATGVVHRELVGEVGRRAIVVDDILDTGGTLVSCCHELARRRVEEVTAMVTHGLFTGERWRELLSLVAGLYVTDSVPSAPHLPEPVRVLSVLPLIEQALARAARTSYVGPHGESSGPVRGSQRGGASPRRGA